MKMNNPSLGRKRLLLLIFPWVILMGSIGVIAFDNLRDRGGPAAESAQATAIDPVCGMSVGTHNAHSHLHNGKVWYFCNKACLDSFVETPEDYAAMPATGEAPTMKGIPTWMYQLGVAIIILLSFFVFERIKVKPADAVRYNLTRLPGVRAALKSPALILILRGITAAAFLLVIAAGLFGDQNPALNITPMLTWTVWWAGLVVVILFLGKAWCTVCPWDAIASWVEKLSGGGLGLRWPASMRNIWFAVAFFIGLTWIELGMGITLIPRATAWIALGMLGLAIGSVLIFEKKAFCQYGCLVGRVSGLYAMFGALEVRAADRGVCADCKTMDCYRGNEMGDPCPTNQFLKVMDQSTYCTMCTECFKSCPEDNVALQVRPWAADMEVEGKPRTDEAFLALVLLSMTSFHGLTMTPRWGELSAQFPFTALMIVMLALPIVIYAVLVRASAAIAPEIGFKKLFIAYAYAMLPIALFYHLAHNAEHLLMEGPKLISLVSDPFGWGWNLFGTAGDLQAPWVTLEGLWGLQVIFVLVGHVYSLWISAKTTRRLIPDVALGFKAQLPMLGAMIAFSVFSLWLLKQPMEMRVSAM